MKQIQNSYWLVEVADDASSIVLTDRKHGGVWKTTNPFYMSYGNYYAYNLLERCRTTVECADGVLSICLDNMKFYGRFPANPYNKPEPSPDLTYRFEFRLEDDEVVFTMLPIDGMDEEEQRLTVLSDLMAMDSNEKGTALLPCGYGSLYRFPRTDSFNVRYGYGTCYTTMTTGGLFRENGAGIAFYSAYPWDFFPVFTVNQRKGRSGFNFTFENEATLGNEPHDIHFKAFAAGESYNEMAKWYRGVLKHRGQFKSYAQKIAEYPEAEKLVGTVVWKHNVYSTETSPKPHSYSLYIPRPDGNQYEGLPNDWTAKEVFDTAKATGFDRVCVYNTGWNRFGYDSGYPTRLPPNPERGTPEQFTAMAKYARSLSNGYIYSVHDNYIDVYRNSPEDIWPDVIRTIDGGYLRGGIWRGGRARVLCTKQALKFAQRDMPQMVEMLGRGSIYIDVYGCSGLNRCFHPDHPMSRHDDVLERRKLFKYIVSQFGSMATEGGPADFVADIASMGAFAGYAVSAHGSGNEPPIPVPFWQLVFHDSILSYSSEAAYGPSGKEYITYSFLYGMLPTGFDEESLRLSKELRQTFTSEMVRHELVGDVTIEDRAWPGPGVIKGTMKTTFADGTTVIAHFNGLQSSYEVIK